MLLSILGCLMCVAVVALACVAVQMLAILADRILG